MHRDMKFEFHHCFREGNSVADSLANLGCEHSSDFEFMDLQSLPSSIRDGILLDVRNTPHVRIS